MVDCSAIVESINIEVVVNSVRLRCWIRRMCQSPKEKEGRITKGSRPSLKVGMRAEWKRNLREDAIRQVCTVVKC